MQRVSGVGSRPSGPYGLSERSGRHRASGIQRESDQQGAQAGPAERNSGSVDPHLERPEDAHLHAVTVPASTAMCTGCVRFVSGAGQPGPVKRSSTVRVAAAVALLASGLLAGALGFGWANVAPTFSTVPLDVHLTFRVALFARNGVIMPVLMVASFAATVWLAGTLRRPGPAR